MCIRDSKLSVDGCVAIVINECCSARALTPPATLAVVPSPSSDGVDERGLLGPLAIIVWSLDDELPPDSVGSACMLGLLAATPAAPSSVGLTRLLPPAAS